MKAAAAANETNAMAEHLTACPVLPPLHPIAKNIPVSNDLSRQSHTMSHSPTALPSLIALPGLRGAGDMVGSLRGDLTKQKRDRNGGEKTSNISGLLDVSVLHVRSMRSDNAAVSSPTRWQPSPLPPLSASPLPPPGPHQFKQTFTHADNDLSAPFRQDVTIKRPILNSLVPADAASQKANLRHRLLLQDALKQSNLLGPGHSLCASIAGASAHSNAPAELSAALSNLSKHHAAKAGAGSMVKRNFALS